MRLRQASENDRPTVSHLLLMSGLVPLDEEAQFGSQYVLAVGDEGRVIGVAGIEVHGKDGLLRSVAVTEDKQGQGIGRSLTHDRLLWARQNSLEELFLLTTTATDYWRRYGFEPFERSTAPLRIQTSREWNSACPASATAMRKRL